MSVSFVLEALVVLGAIVMGTRAGGVGVGLWGGLGTFVLVFVFREPPGEPPAAALAIILAVVTSAAMMQAAGGIDWMVSVVAGVIKKQPRQITLIAPLTAFLFSIGAGTSNIIYPPLTVTVVQSGMALAASPVSAAMAAMLTLTDVEPYNLGLTQILAITIPSCVVGIVVTSLVVNRMWTNLDDDEDIQAKIASGQLVAPQLVGAGDSASTRLTYTKEGRSSALAFLFGVVAIVILGLFPQLRPSFAAEGEAPVAIDMTTTIVLVMFVV